MIFFQGVCVDSLLLYVQCHFFCKIIWCNESVSTLQSFKDMELPFECFSHNFCANYEIWKMRVVVLLLVINILSVLFSMLFQTMIVSVWYLLYMYPHVLQRRDISSHYDGWMPSEMRFTCSQFLPKKVRDICKFATIQCENALKWTKKSMKTTCCLTCLHIKCCCSVTYLGTKLYSKCTKFTQQRKFVTNYHRSWHISPLVLWLPSEL